MFGGSGAADIRSEHPRAYTKSPQQGGSVFIFGESNVKETPAGSKELQKLAVRDKLRGRIGDTQGQRR